MTAAPHTAEQLAVLADIGSVFHFAGDRLAFDASHPLAERLVRKTLSPSSANALSSCPSRWAVEYLLPDEQDPFAANHLGTAGHAVMEDLMALPPAERTSARAADLLNDLHVRHTDLIVPDDPLQMGLWRSEVATRVAGLFDIEDPSTVTVVGRELKVKAEIGGVILGGIIDRIDAVPDGKGGYTLVIRDYKCGKHKAPNARYTDTEAEQQRLYAMAVETLGMDGLEGHKDATTVPGLRPVVTGASLYYTRYGKARGVSVDVRAKNRTKARFVAAWNTLQESLTAGSFATKAGGLCGWCPLVALCPTAVAANKKDTSGKSAIGELLNLGGARPNQPPHTVVATAIQTGASLMSKFVEANRYDNEVNGALNGNGVTATAVFGLTTMAADILVRANQKIGASLPPFVATLAGIVGEVQARHSDNKSMSAGLNTRIRGVLHSVLAMPGTEPPFGADAAAWVAWRQAVIARVEFITVTAHGLWANEAPAEPWLALVATTTANAA